MVARLDMWFGTEARRDEARWMTTDLQPCTPESLQRRAPAQTHPAACRPRRAQSSAPDPMVGISSGVG